MAAKAIKIENDAALQILKRRLEQEFDKPFPMYQWMDQHRLLEYETTFFVDCWVEFTTVLSKTKIERNADYFLLFVRPDPEDDNSGKVSNDNQPPYSITRALEMFLDDPDIVDWSRVVIFEYVDVNFTESFMKHRKFTCCVPKTMFTIREEKDLKNYYDLEDFWVLDWGADEIYEDHVPDSAKGHTNFPPELRLRQNTVCMLRETATVEDPSCVAYAIVSTLGDVSIRFCAKDPPDLRSLTRALYRHAVIGLLKLNISPVILAKQEDSVHVRDAGLHEMKRDGRVIRVRRLVSEPSR